MKPDKSILNIFNIDEYTFYEVIYNEIINNNVEKDDDYKLLIEEIILFYQEIEEYEKCVKLKEKYEQTN